MKCYIPPSHHVLYALATLTVQILATVGCSCLCPEHPSLPGSTRELCTLSCSLCLSLISCYSSLLPAVYTDVPVEPSLSYFWRQGHTTLETGTHRGQHATFRVVQQCKHTIPSMYLSGYVQWQKHIKRASSKTATVLSVVSSRCFMLQLTQPPRPTVRMRRSCLKHWKSSKLGKNHQRINSCTWYVLFKEAQVGGRRYIYTQKSKVVKSCWTSLKSVGWSLSSSRMHLE